MIECMGDVSEEEDLHRLVPVAYFPRPSPDVIAQPQGWTHPLWMEDTIASVTAVCPALRVLVVLNATKKCLHVFDIGNFMALREATLDFVGIVESPLWDFQDGSSMAFMDEQHGHALLVRDAKTGVHEVSVQDLCCTGLAFVVGTDLDTNLDTKMAVSGSLVAVGYQSNCILLYWCFREDSPKQEKTWALIRKIWVARERDTYCNFFTFSPTGDSLLVLVKSGSVCKTRYETISVGCHSHWVKSGFGPCPFSLKDSRDEHYACHKADLFASRSVSPTDKDMAVAHVQLGVMRSLVMKETMEDAKPWGLGWAIVAHRYCGVTVGCCSPCVQWPHRQEEFSLPEECEPQGWRLQDQAQEHSRFGDEAHVSTVQDVVMFVTWSWQYGLLAFMPTWATMCMQMSCERTAWMSAVARYAALRCPRHSFSRNARNGSGLAIAAAKIAQQRMKETRQPQEPKGYRDPVVLDRAALHKLTKPWPCKPT
jgi:hypothetical protein